MENGKKKKKPSSLFTTLTEGSIGLVDFSKSQRYTKVFKIS